jgi:putative sigma-54 modulation protein
MESSGSISDYAKKKMEKVEKYLIEPIEVHFVMSVEKIRHIAEVTINANGVTIKGEESTGDMYSAIDLVMDKIGRQVKKHKEKLKSHKGNPNLPLSTIEPELQPSEERDDSIPPRVVKAENLHVKPMSIDEAVMQMDLLDNNFLVFTNSKSESLNVLYRRKDGDYGLIVPNSK